MPGSQTTRGLAAVTRTAPPAAAIAVKSNAAVPAEAPSPASGFWKAMGVPHAWGAQNFGRCVCVYVFAFL